MLNINKLFKNGFDSFLIEKIHLKQLEKLVQKENWVALEQTNKNTIKSTPQWMFDNINIKTNNNGIQEFKEGTYNQCKEFISYKKVFDQMLQEDKYNGFLNSHYVLEINTIQLWDGVEEDPLLHWDGKVNGDIFFLLYLSDYEKWNKEFGGGLLGGTRELSNDQNWEHTNLNPNNLIDSQVFYPDNGRIVYGNNTNPRQIHKPINISESAKDKGVKRITFLVTINLIPKKSY